MTEFKIGDRVIASNTMSVDTGTYGTIRSKRRSDGCWLVLWDSEVKERYIYEAWLKPVPYEPDAEYGINPCSEIILRGDKMKFIDNGDGMLWNPEYDVKIKHKSYQLYAIYIKGKLETHRTSLGECLEVADKYRQEVGEFQAALNSGIVSL